METKIMNKKELNEFFKHIFETGLSYCVEPIDNEYSKVTTYDANKGESSNGSNI